MLEWLSSKMAVALAAMLLLSSTAAFFATEDGRMRDRELAVIARRIAEFIGEVFQVQGTSVLKASCAMDADLSLPKDVRGSLYRIQLRQDSVIVGQEDRQQVAHWSGVLHLWRFDDSTISGETIERLDEEHQSIELQPCRGFLLSLKLVDIGGPSTFLAFAYLDS